MYAHVVARQADSMGGMWLGRVRAGMWCVESTVFHSMTAGSMTH
ncbi:hypothetical protein [Ephemeroptericola cinctiostellae]|nr:hypothetical protein [Ephemeroptericola cinctiostellae]